MNDSLLGCATDLVRLATTIRSGLESAERTIPAINEHLAGLATLGITDFQIEGSTIYCRPAGWQRSDRVMMDRRILSYPHGPLARMD